MASQEPPLIRSPEAVTYVAYGRSLRSEVLLPELERTELPPEIFIVRSNEPLALDPSPRRSLGAEEETWLVVGQSQGLPVLSFPGVVDCAVDLAARRITCHPAPGADGGALRHVLLDQVVPRMLSATGSTVLHASAVLVDGSAVLFAGLSGAGKSTLAARCAAAGHAVLSDDAVALDASNGQWQAVASYPGLRLWPASLELLGSGLAATPLAFGSSKGRVDTRRWAVAAGTSHPLAAIVLLERRTGPTEARRLRGVDAFGRLWATTFGWPVDLVDEALLDRVTALAQEACVLEICFGQDAPVDEILGAVLRSCGQP